MPWVRPDSITGCALKGRVHQCCGVRTRVSQHASQGGTHALRLSERSVHLVDGRIIVAADVGTLTGPGRS